MKMKGASIFIGCMLLLLGCGINNSDENSIEDPLPFNWIVNNRSFPDPGGVNSVFIDEEDELIISTDSAWYTSNNYGVSFRQRASPDSVYFDLVKKLDGIYYASGRISTNYSIIGDSVTYGWTRSRNILYRSEDGENWDHMSGPYESYDFDVMGNQAYVSQYSGIVAVDLLEQTEFGVQFLFTNSLDFVNAVLIYNENEILVGSHDGIHKSYDSGSTWEKTSYEISKDLDYTRKLFRGTGDQIYSYGTRLLFSEDIGETWEILPMEYLDEDEREGFYPYDIAIHNEGYVYGINYQGLYVADITSLDDFRFAGVVKYTGVTGNGTSDYEEVYTFSNGTVLISSLYNYNYLVGEKNPNSSFWD